MIETQSLFAVLITRLSLERGVAGGGRLSSSYSHFGYNGGKVSSTQPFPPYSLLRVGNSVGREWSKTFPPEAMVRVAALILGVCAMTGCSTVGKQSAAANPAPAPVFAIPRMPSVIIDAGPGDWGEGGFRVDALIPDQGPMPAPQDCAAGMRLGWNDAGLLVLLEVAGRDWSEAEKTGELFGRDSVEFYLARYPGSTARCQWLVAPGMDARFPEPRVNLQDFATSPALRQNAVAPGVARQRTAAGYRMEVLLPWRTLGLSPKPGDEVAFQVMVNSHDRKGRPADHLLWFPTTGAAFDSRKLHRLRLADKPAPPVTARARVRVDYREFKTECDVFAPEAAAGQEVRLRSAGGVLASGTLAAGSNGFARATLTGPGTDDPVVYLDVNGRLADVVPLTLPRAEMAIETQVRLEPGATNLAAVLTLPDAPPPGYRVARRQPDEAWQVLASNAPSGAFRDTALSKEKLYEYAVTRGGDGATSDYFWTGSAIPLRDRRGTLLLLVERSQAEALAAELRRLTLDLVGDGWQVSRQEVASNQTPAEIKQWIRAEYDRAPEQVNTVLLVGHVPVFRTGSVRPDGHGGGPSPADVYYGALEGNWGEATTNNAVKEGHGRASGSGWRERNGIPGRVQLAVGRVDFSNMPAFGVDETTLLRRYLDRDHAYRQARLPVAERAFVHDNFFGQPERFAYSGWQNFTTLLNPNNVRTATWPNVKPGMSLFFYVCGPGYGATGPVAGFGDTADLVKTPLEAVFTMVFGSFVYEWDLPNNLLRATLAHERGALTCGWAGRPHWYLHSMGMGETIGDCLRRTQNNDGSDYQPTGAFARGVHIALLGDPTLRLHRVAPPADLRAQAAGRGMRLSWAASPQKAAGYHVYRAEAEFGPYERLTKEPVKGLTADDPDGRASHYYQVRAVVLQESTTGTYYNSSQGIFAGPATASPSRP